MSAAITVAANAADWSRITLYVVLALALALFLLVALPIIAPPSRIQIVPIASESPAGGGGGEVPTLAGGLIADFRDAAREKDPRRYQ